MVKMESQGPLRKQNATTEVTTAAAGGAVEPTKVTPNCKEKNEFSNHENNDDKQITTQSTTCKLFPNINQEQHNACNISPMTMKNQQIEAITKSGANNSGSNTNSANVRRNSLLMIESTSLLPPVTEGKTMENIYNKQHSITNSIGDSNAADTNPNSNLSSLVVKQQTPLRPTLRDLRRFSSQEDNNNNNGTTNGSCSSTTSLDRSTTSPIAIVQSSSSSSSSYYNYKRRNSSISQCSSNLSENTRAQLNFDLSPDLLADSTLNEANSVHPMTTTTTTTRTPNEDFLLDDLERPPSPEPSSPSSYVDNSPSDDHTFKLEVDFKPTSEQLTTNGLHK